MVSEIAAAITSLKAAGEIAKAMLDLRDATAFQTQAFELNRQILAAQESAIAANTAQTALIEKIGTLEKEITDLKAWDREKERYQMTDVGNGVIAFTRKPDAQGSEPFHMLCANCYEHRKKSYLQPTAQSRQRLRVHRCPDCKSEFEFGYVPMKEVRVIRQAGPFDD
jgi:hypothetical protein